jgi:hypothetical protein
MNSMIRRCLAMTAGAALLALVLLAAGVPGAILLGLAPALVCVGMHLVMGHGDAHGEEMYRTARAAAELTDLPVDELARMR